ncbi:11654_t:CDS:1, partial [Ambispora gerdemannii]
ENLKIAIIAGTCLLIPDDIPPTFEKFIREAWNGKWIIDVIINNL